MTPAVDHPPFTRLIAIRHGETAWNAENRIQGQLDIDLNARGRWQGARLGAALLDDGLAVVYASDLKRAFDTAGALAAAVGCEVRVDPGLRERHFGEFQGFTYDEIGQRWPASFERWRQRDPAFGPAGGETLQAFYRRSIATATRIAAGHPGQSIALVAHGGVLDCLYRAAARIALEAPRTWKVGNAGVSRLLCTADGFTLVGWNDEQHLRPDAA